MAYIRLMGSGNEVINGNGAILHTMGSGRTTVNGDLQSVTHMSSGKLSIHGNVKQGVHMTGSGYVKIDGSVKGKVLHMGSGNLKICGDVYGNIIQMGTGHLIVKGTWYGNTKTQMGTGRITLSAKGSPGSSTKATSTKSKENRSDTSVAIEDPNNQIGDGNAKAQVDSDVNLDFKSSKFVLPLFKKHGIEEQELITFRRVLSLLSSLLLFWTILKNLE